MFFQGNEKYNCATYLRLSRSDGDQQESNSIKNQRALLNDYMGKHPELHKFDEYVDDGYSGTNFERPDFKRMMQDIEKRNVNCIIVKDLSRFGRNYIETGRYLERIFPFMGVRFIAINDHYMKIPEIARALDAQGVPSPQIQMAKKKRSRTKIKWPDSTIRSILKNPLYIGKCTLTLAKAKRELEVPAIVSETEFQKAQKKLESTRLPSRKKARKKPNLLFKKIYDKESGKGLLCRTSEDESQQVYSFDKGYRCFSGKAPFIESEKIFREILSALEKEKMQAAHIDRVLDLNPEKVKQCMDAGLLQYRKRANEIVAHLMAKDDERTAVYREYEQGSISLEQVEEYEHQYQVAVQKQEADFKKVMLVVNDIEKAFSHGNPWLMKFRAISIPEKLERTHLKEWLDHVWIVDFEQVEVILQESEWKGFFPEEWLNSGEEDCNGKKE